MIMEKHRVIFFVTYFSSSLQIVAAILTPINIWRNRKAHGFSICFHILFTIALLHKYVLIGEEDQFEIRAIMDEAYFIQYRTRILLSISIIIGFVLSSVFFDKRDFDAFTVCNLCIGFLVGMILGAKHVSGRTAKDWWMATSYLEIIAWIQQLKLSLKTKPAGSHVMFYIISMFSYDVLNMTGLSYDFYHMSLYGNPGHTLLMLKFLLFCGFFWSYWWYTPRIENKVDVTEVVPATSLQSVYDKKPSPKERSGELMCCMCVKDVLIVKQEFSARY